LLGCHSFEDIMLLDDGGTAALCDMKMAPPPDLAPPPAKCAAAKGLAGDVLANICVDFNKVTGLSDQALMGWDFTSLCPNGWDVVGGKLVIKNFGQFASTCSVTLSVIQRVDINASQQTALAALGSALPVRTFWNSSGKTEHQQLMISMTRTDPVPTAANQIFQYLLQLTSGVMAGGTATGWQIESIAVLGNP
jgi:hypothetical protein